MKAHIYERHEKKTQYLGNFLFQNLFEVGEATGNRKNCRQVSLGILKNKIQIAYQTEEKNF